MPVSCLIHLSTNSTRCSMGDVSFQGTDPPQVRTVGVTHVLGPGCYPCPRFVPVQGEEPWGVARRPRLKKKNSLSDSRSATSRRPRPKRLKKKRGETRSGTSRRPRLLGET